MVFFLPLLAIAATAASSAMAYQQARGQAAHGAAMSDLNNTEVLANYRRNIDKLSSARVEARKESLTVQGNINKTYRRSINAFQGAYAENWGQSANLYMQSLARAAGEDTEQLQQNLQNELQASKEQEEELRLGTRSQLTAPPPDQSKSVLASGIINTGFQAVSSVFEIKAAQRSKQVQDLQLQKSQQELLLVRDERARLQTLLSGGPIRASQFGG